jgi:F0F1-type ATP synthase assembly protein I
MQSRTRERESSLVIFAKAFPPHVIGIMVVQIALINGALMIGGVFLGMMLDRQFGTSPLLTLALPILGAVLSVVMAYRLGLRAIKKSRKAYLQWQGKSEAEAESEAEAVVNKRVVSVPEVH